MTQLSKSSNWSYFGVFGLGLAIASLAYWATSEAMLRDLKSGAWTAQATRIEKLEHLIKALETQVKFLTSRAVPTEKDGESKSVVGEKTQSGSGSAAGTLLSFGQDVLTDSHVSELVGLASNASAQSVATVSGMMTYMSVLFAVVLFGAAFILNFQVTEAKRELEEFRDKLHQDKEVLERALGRVDVAATSAMRAMEQTKATIVEEKREAEIVSRKVGEVLEGIILVLDSSIKEIFGSWAGPSASPKVPRSQRVLQKSHEMRGRVLLLHPSEARRVEGIYLLGASGTNIAKVDLMRLCESESAREALKELIRSAVRRIDERILGSGPSEDEAPAV